MDGLQADQSEQRAPDHAARQQASMPGRSIWHPAAGYGRLIGLLFSAGLTLISILSLLLLIQDSGTVRVVWLVLLIGSLAGLAGVLHLLRGLASMRYVFAEDHLRIEWRKVVRQVPYDDMLEVTYHLRDVVDLPYREPYWPGYRVSTIRTRDGIWHSYATVPPHRRVRITTPVAVFAISPERPVLFIQELERRRLGTSDVVASTIEPVSALSPPPAVRRTRKPGSMRGVTQPVRASLDLFRNELLTDSIASTLVAVGVIIPVFLLAYTFNEVDFLPERIPLQWNAAGEAVRTGGSSSIWLLPLLALSVLIINAALATLVIQFDRIAARLLVAITPLVQVTVAIALWRVIS